MNDDSHIRMAVTADAHRIAVMSRDLIEHGLGWSWTPSRVAREIHSPSANVILGTTGDTITGFAIMRYREMEARLNLFAVHPAYRRQGVGTSLMRWLEKTALVCGIGTVYLEVRQSNQVARQFYEKSGFRVIQTLPGYYARREHALRMARDLWVPSPCCPKDA